MVSVAPVVGASVPTVGGRGGKRSVKERETETAPADRPQDFPARGKKALKQEDSETGTAPARGWGGPVGRREAEREGV